MIVYCSCRNVTVLGKNAYFVVRFLRGLAVPFLLLTLTQMALAESGRSANDVEVSLKEVALRMFDYAAKHEERLPKSRNELLEFFGEESDLVRFVNDPNFKYHANGLAVWELRGESLLCSYKLSDNLKLVLMGYGDVRSEPSVPPKIKEKAEAIDA